MEENGKRPIITHSIVNGSEDKKLINLYKSPMIVTNPGQLIMPYNFHHVTEKIQSFNVRTDDVWILSYPRTGSNWLQEITWLVGNNLNFDAARETELSSRSILLEGSAMLSEHCNIKPEETIELLEDEKSPRHIKSHLPWNYLPIQLETIKPKIVYVARNPKDVCVSYYLFMKTNFGILFPFDDFCDLFMMGKVTYGNYLEHVLTFWNLRHHSNILFLKYEDMKKDIEGVIRQISKFLEQNLTEYDIKELVDHVSFQNMNKNSAIASQGIVKSRTPITDKFELMRKGEADDWKNHMSEKIIEKFDAWTEKYFTGTGLNFDSL